VNAKGQAFLFAKLHDTGDLEVYYLSKDMKTASTSVVAFGPGVEGVSGAQKEEAQKILGFITFEVFPFVHFVANFRTGCGLQEDPNA